MLVPCLIMFAILALLTFRSLRPFSQPFSSYGAPLFGYAILLVLFIAYRFSWIVLAVYGGILIVGLIIWAVIFHERAENIASANTWGGMVGAVTGRIADFFDSDGSNRLVQNLRIRANNALSAPAEESDAAPAGHIFNIAFALAACICAVVMLIRYR